jgi:hypothetical protein
MSSDDPFAVSSGSLGDRSGRARDVAVAEVSARTIEILNKTRPWVQLMGVLMWIGTVLMGIACVFGLVGGLISQKFEFVLISALYILFTLVYAALARSLTTYASRINKLNTSEDVKDLEDALESQRAFWRLVGIITLVCIVGYILVLVLVFSGAMMMGSFMRR